MMDSFATRDRMISAEPIRISRPSTMAVARPSLSMPTAAPSLSSRRQGSSACQGFSPHFLNIPYMPKTVSRLMQTFIQSVVTSWKKNKITRSYIVCRIIFPPQSGFFHTVMLLAHPDSAPRRFSL